MNQVEIGAIAVASIVGALVGWAAWHAVLPAPVPLPPAIVYQLNHPDAPPCPQQIEHVEQGFEHYRAQLGLARSVRQAIVRAELADGVEPTSLQVDLERPEGLR
jgi:hypothetical protein